MTSDTTDLDGCDVGRKQKHHGTQTNEGTIKNIVSVTPSLRLPLPREIQRSAEGSITLFEFCHVIQDPDSPQSVTIIKETVSEDSKSHPKEINYPSDKDKAASNRYEYCKEVIKPYLKYSADCPDSNEKLLKDALDIVSEDFPDSWARPDEEDAEVTNTTSKSTNSSAYKVDVSTSTDMGTEPKEPTSVVIIKTECGEYASVVGGPLCSPQISSFTRLKPICPPLVSACSPEPEPESPEPPPSLTDASSSTPKQKPRNPCCPPMDRGKCSKKKREDAARKPPCSAKHKPSSCQQELTIGACPKTGGREDEKTKYIIRKKRYIDIEPTPSTEKLTSFLLNSQEIELIKENHMKTVCTIKTAFENFMGKVAESSHEAISMITKESCKHLEKLKESEMSKKCCDHDCKASFTSRFFQKADDNTRSRTRHIEEHAIGIRDEFPKLAEAVDTIVTAVDSTVSTITAGVSQSFDGFPKRIKPFKSIENCPPFDKPTTPKDVSNTHQFLPDSGTISNTSGIFSAIKSRIFSIFSNDPLSTVSRPSSNSSCRSSSN